MFHRIFTLAFAATFIVNALRAADSNPIKEQYWQSLPNVYMVWTDHAGSPWFRTVGGDVAASYATNFKQLGMEQTFLLGDRRGRVWVSDPKHAGPAKYFDGKQWHATKIFAEKAFEDSAGRVFLADGSRIHVLDRDTWTAQEIVAKPTGGETQFAEDGRGRVWAWVTGGTMGVWFHESGKWTNHHSSNGFPTDNVTLLLPITGDRLLIWPKEPLRKRHYAVWAPGRALDDAEAKPFGDLVPTALRYVGTDLDRTHYFDADGLPPADREHMGRSRELRLTARGDVKLGAAASAGRANLPVGRYGDRHLILTRQGEIPIAPPCDPRDAVCREREGRIYFRDWYTIDIH